MLKIRKNNIILDVPENKVAEYKEAFNKFDKNNKGKISANDICETMKSFGYPISQKQMEMNIEEISSSGELDFEEFIILLIKSENFLNNTDENKDLKTSKSSVKNNDYKNINNNLENENTDLKISKISENDKYKNINSNLENEIHSLKTKLNEYEKKNEQLEKKVLQIEKEKNVLNNKLNQYINDNNILKSKLLKLENDSKNEKICNNSKDYNELFSKLKKMENNFNDIKTKMIHYEKENKRLENENKDLIIKINNQNSSNIGTDSTNNKDEIISLLKKIQLKDEEIKELKSRAYDLKKDEKLMTVIFSSVDQKIHYAPICKNTDRFNNVENLLYEVYPEYAEYDNTFTANGNKIIKSKTMEQNKIKFSDVILLTNNNNE